MFVYLIRLSENSYYKIGTTKNINKRIKELQTGNAEEIFLVDHYRSDRAFKIEGALHNFFKHKKKINEWFDFGIEDEIKFKELCKNIDDNLKYLDKNKI
jgi:predicted GIY-YIG superfamily endonuclease